MTAVLEGKDRPRAGVRVNLWQTTRQRWPALLLILLGLAMLLYGGCAVAWCWYYADQLYFHCDVLTTGATVINGFIATTGYGQIPAGVLAAWILMGWVVLGAGVLWWKKRFSLRALILLVVLAAASASITRVVPVSIVRTGWIIVHESSWEDDPRLSDDDLKRLIEEAKPSQLGALFPPEARAKLGVGPEAITDLRIIRKHNYPNIPSAQVTCHVELAAGLSDVQRASLFHFVAHWLTLRMGAWKKTKVPSASVGFQAHPNNTASRWQEWSKEFEEASHLRTQTPP